MRWAGGRAGWLLSAAGPAVWTTSTDGRAGRRLSATGRAGGQLPLTGESGQAGCRLSAGGRAGGLQNYQQRAGWAAGYQQCGGRVGCLSAAGRAGRWVGGCLSAAGRERGGYDGDFDGPGLRHVRRAPGVSRRIRLIEGAIGKRGLGFGWLGLFPFLSGGFFVFSFSRLTFSLADRGYHLQGSSSAVPPILRQPSREAWIAARVRGGGSRHHEGCRAVTPRSEPGWWMLCLCRNRPR